MKLLHSDLIQEFYKNVKEEHPDLSLSEVEKICSSPFRKTRETIESGKFLNVRLQFFGIFVASPKRIKGMLDVYTRKFKECTIDPQMYFKKKKMLEESLIQKEKVCLKK
jgi:nucleoid DNA-binding protein